MILGSGTCCFTQEESNISVLKAFNSEIGAFSVAILSCICQSPHFFVRSFCLTFSFLINLKFCLQVTLTQIIWRVVFLYEMIDSLFYKIQESSPDKTGQTHIFLRKHQNFVLFFREVVSSSYKEYHLHTNYVCESKKRDISYRVS